MIDELPSLIGVRLSPPEMEGMSLFYSFFLSILQYPVKCSKKKQFSLIFFFFESFGTPNIGLNLFLQCWDFKKKNSWKGFWNTWRHIAILNSENEKTILVLFTTLRFQNYLSITYYIGSETLNMLQRKLKYLRFFELLFFFFVFLRNWLFRMEEGFGCCWSSVHMRIDFFIIIIQFHFESHNKLYYG